MLLGVGPKLLGVGPKLLGVGSLLLGAAVSRGVSEIRACWIIGWRGMLRSRGRSRCAGCDVMCIAACWGIGWRGMSCSTECLPCCWESGPCCWESGSADSLAVGLPASSCLSPLQTRVFNDNVLLELSPKRQTQFHCRLSAMSTHGRLKNRRRRGMRPALLSSRVTRLMYLLVRSTWCKLYGARCLLCAACCAQRQGYSSRSWLDDRGLLVTQQSRRHRVESAT